MKMGEKHDCECYVCLNVSLQGEELKKYLFVNDKKANIAQRFMEREWIQEGFVFFTRCDGNRIFQKEGAGNRFMFLSIENKKEMKPISSFKTFVAKVENPLVFVSHFDSKEEFRQWCEEGTKEDLECTLKAFEESEAYEWCIIINEVLKGKGNE